MKLHLREALQCGSSRKGCGLGCTLLLECGKHGTAFFSRGLSDRVTRGRVLQGKKVEGLRAWKSVD